MSIFKSKKKLIIILTFIAIIITIFIVFLFKSGILTDSLFNKLDYKAGTFDGTKYENKSIGLSMYLPDDWHINDKEMLLLLADANYQTLSDEEKSTYDPKDIISIYDFSAYKKDGITSMTVSVDRVSLLTENKSDLTINEYINLLKEGKTGRDVSNYTFDDKKTSITLSDRKYTMLSAHFTEAETIKTYYIFAARGDYYVMITFTFDESKSDEINNMLENNFK